MRHAPPTGFWLAVWLVLAVAYALTGWLCIQASAVVANVSWMPFVPAGLSLTAGLLWGARVSPGVFVGELALVLMSGEPPGSGLIMATGNAIDCALAGWWFHDRPGRRVEFDNVHDVVSLLAAELLLLEPVSTGLGILALSVSGHLPAEKLWTTAAAWYAANVFAKFLIAPTVLVWLRWSRPALQRENHRELATLAVLTLFVGAFGVGRWAMHHLPLPVTLIFVFPLLVWAAVRFAPSVGVTIGCVLGLFAFEAALSGQGSFHAETRGDHIFYLNVFMGVCLGTALFLTAAWGQQRKFEDAQARLIEQLREAAAQVRHLEEIVTFCSWTGRVRWKDQWVPMEQFLVERFGLNVSHGISEEAFARMRTTLRAEQPPPPGAEPGRPEPS